MSNIIKIKRGNGAPSQGTLKDGELGFDKEGESLYIGVENDAGEPLAPINLTQGIYVGDEEVTEDATISINADTVDGYHAQDIVAQARENMAQSAHSHKASDITSGVIGVEKGGTGKNQHTVNSVLVGNGEEPVKNITTESGALFATAANSAPKFGVLPYAQGGTGYALKDIPKYAIMRNAGDGQYMWYLATGNGALFATAANGAPKFDTLPIKQGGTGATSEAAARTKLGLNPAALWTNPAPSSNYGSSTFPTISLDLSSYRFVLISFLTTSGGNNYAGTILVPVDDTSSGNTNDTMTRSVHIQYKPASANFYDRYARATKTGVVISTGRTVTSFGDTAWGVDNSLLVPYQIFGIV